MTSGAIISTGERVYLAEMTAEDQPHFQRWLAENEELRRLIDQQSIPTIEDQMGWFEGCQRREDRELFSVFLISPEGESEKAEKGPILLGNGGLVNIDLDSKTAEFRITLGNTAYLGQGFGTEATQLILDYGFDQLGLEAISLMVLPSNERALAMYRKLGFVEAGEEEGKVVMRLFTRT